jgi:hypothetical protein
VAIPIRRLDRFLPYLGLILCLESGVGLLWHLDPSPSILSVRISFPYQGILFAFGLLAMIARSPRGIASVVLWLGAVVSTAASILGPVLAARPRSQFILRILVESVPAPLLLGSLVALSEDSQNVNHRRLARAGAIATICAAVICSSAEIWEDPDLVRLMWERSRSSSYEVAILMFHVVANGGLLVSGVLALRSKEGASLDAFRLGGGLIFLGGVSGGIITFLLYWIFQEHVNPSSDLRTWTYFGFERVILILMVALMTSRSFRNPDYRYKSESKLNSSGGAET